MLNGPKAIQQSDPMVEEHQSYFIYRIAFGSPGRIPNKLALRILHAALMFKTSTINEEGLSERK